MTVGQKRNKINQFSPISQYLNQVFENEEQFLNIDIEHIRKAVLVVRNKYKASTASAISLTPLSITMHYH